MTAESSTSTRPAGPPLDGSMQAEREQAPAGEQRFRVPLGLLDRAVAHLVTAEARFVTLFAGEAPEPSLVAVFALHGDLVVLRAPLAESRAYASLSLSIPACRWPERELHDLHGLTPLAHPDLRPLVRPDADRVERRVAGDDVFVIPYGPIRSGVFEAIQFVIETGGEDVLALEVKPRFKRRALERRLAGVPLDQAAFVAERVAGISSVAHAVACSGAVERALGVDVPPRAATWRVVLAELERIANHLDVATRLAEDPALGVGAARFGILKEDVQWLQAKLTGSRFARGVVCPGGIRFEPFLAPAEIGRSARELERDFLRDRRLLLRTASLTDRLIGSGRLDRSTVVAFAGVGPVARASGVATDARFERPYAAYGRLGFDVVTGDEGDAMARLEVRFGEIQQSLHLIRQALDRLERDPPELRSPLPALAGAACGWSEAAQGEVVYAVRVSDGRVTEARIASPSARNWPLFAEAFRGDVLTDFAFVEHSFGLTPAGADR